LFAREKWKFHPVDADLQNLDFLSYIVPCQGTITPTIQLLDNDPLTEAGRGYFSYFTQDTQYQPTSICYKNKAYNFAVCLECLNLLVGDVLDVRKQDGNITLRCILEKYILLWELYGAI